MIATEIEPTKVSTGREDLADAGLPTWSSSWKGRCAATTLPHQRPLAVELLFIVADNADKPGYREYTEDHPKLVSDTVDGRGAVSLWVG